MCVGGGGGVSVPEITAPSCYLSVFMNGAGVMLKVTVKVKMMVIVVQDPCGWAEDLWAPPFLDSQVPVKQPFGSPQDSIRLVKD